MDACFLQIVFSFYICDYDYAYIPISTDRSSHMPSLYTTNRKENLEIMKIK